MIRTLASLLAGLVLALGTPALAQTQMTVGEAASVLLAVNRGTLIYYYDQAAWHGTDDMIARIGRPEGKVRGWVVDGPPQAAEVVFYDDPADPHAVYSAKFEGTRLVSSHVYAANENRTISPARKALIAAREAVNAEGRKSSFARCSDRPFNTVVLPPEEPGGPIAVYLLTPQTSNDSVPAGLHYRVEVGSDGKLAAPRPFTKSCIQLQTQTDKGRPAAVMVTHLLDPTPTEIHVFTMFAAQLPVYVSTPRNGRLWSVEAPGGRAMIRLLDPKTGTRKKPD